jgi:hypothetical protein
VKDGLTCKRCYTGLLTEDEKETLDGLFCEACRVKYNCGIGFDANSDALHALLSNLVPSIEVISLGKGIFGSSNSWSGNQTKPDMVFKYSASLLVVVEADDDDGHNGSRGNDISRFGEPWKYDRDLNAELVKMQTTCKALESFHGQKVLFIRCNSDHTSIRLGDTGLALRAQMIVDKILEVSLSVDLIPENCFRLSLVDIPAIHQQTGNPIEGSEDVYISWESIQQTTIPTSPEELNEIRRVRRDAQKERRRVRQLSNETCLQYHQ